MGMNVPRIKLGPQGLEVSKLRLGCMGMSAFYGLPKPEPDMIKLIHYAINSSVTFLDTSDVYGPHSNEVLIGKALKGGMREKVQLASKFGIIHQDGKREVRGDPAYVRAACEASLKRLDVGCIDLYYVHRIDSRVPIEVTMGELQKLVEGGKVKYVGLSEASASTIRRAHAALPISAVQIEWSLWSRDVEKEIIPTCRELGIGIVPYSPLRGGFLSAGPSLIHNLLETDYRKVSAADPAPLIQIVRWLKMIVLVARVVSLMKEILPRNPRFQTANLESNKLVYQQIVEMATRKGCSPSQLALAWVHHQGDNVCPIPGTTKINNLDENIGALSVSLTSDEIAQLSGLAGMAKGERSAHMTNTPPLSSWKGR